jgi:hypothetical protein
MHVLLLGAGFSRNWGGWLASELVGELSGLLVDRPWLCEMLRVYQNFERTYAERYEAAHKARNNKLALEDVARLQRAILDTFAAMNAGFARRHGLDFSWSPERSIVSFLARFDAIFTLNQDLLLEAHYRGIEKLHRGRWADGCVYPGITSTNGWVTANATERIRARRNVGKGVDYEQRQQPIFKLHGSVDWQNSDGQPVLVIGTGKETAIAGSDLLRQYHEQFAKYLCKGQTRLMVIGYSFSEPHINKVLRDAATTSAMQMYVVDPAGPDVLANGGRQLGKVPIIGMSTRELSRTFGDMEDPSFFSFMRFLAS